jgi:hypothetical protein
MVCAAALGCCCAEGQTLLPSSTTGVQCLLSRIGLHVASETSTYLPYLLDYSIEIESTYALQMVSYRSPTWFVKSDVDLTSELK